MPRDGRCVVGDTVESRAASSMTSPIRIGLPIAPSSGASCAHAQESRGRVSARWPVFGWPSMAMGAVAVAVLAIAIVMHRGAASVPAPEVDQLELQQELSSTDVGLLANYHVVEHLDLLENYDVIEHLDELGPGDRQNHETSS